MKKVLIFSKFTSYNQGGMASMARLIARTFSEDGYNVKVLADESDGLFPCKDVELVVRPSYFRCLIETLEADYVVCVGPVLRLCWPLLFIKKRSIVVKHVAGNPRRLLRRLAERWLSVMSKRAAVGKYVASVDFIHSEVVPNAIDRTVFYDDQRKKKFDIIYVGSLTEEKGVFVLAEAIRLLIDKGVVVNQITFVGEGPAKERLIAVLQTDVGRINYKLNFTGNIPQFQVAEELRNHRCLIVPSMNKRWCEAFGLTPLEGYACGCAVIGSDSGGLLESVGSCGQVFHSGDSQELAVCIENVLSGRIVIDQEMVAEHLALFTPKTMIEKYLEIMNR